MSTAPHRMRVAVVASLLLFVAGFHAATPAGPHAWHWLHVAAERAYYVPILLAAAWWGLPGALLAALAASILAGIHVLVDWRGLEMVQAEQLAEIGSYWAVGSLSAVLISRERRAVEEARSAHEETLDALARSLELREKATGGHSARVRDYAALLAQRLGYADPLFLRNLALGALLHDVGKIGIPDRVLLKEGPLDGREWELMRKHPELGASLIGNIRFLATARDLVLSHHERYDGKGYPRGLAAEAIPIGARIFMLADAFDALTADRPYHAAISWAEAAERISAGRGTHFDPDVVDAFQQVPYEEWARIAIRTGTFVRPHAGLLHRPEAAAHEAAASGGARKEV